MAKRRTIGDYPLNALGSSGARGEVAAIEATRWQGNRFDAARGYGW
jgi:hypothetical protein